MGAERGHTPRGGQVKLEGWDAYKSTTKQVVPPHVRGDAQPELYEEHHLARGDLSISGGMDTLQKSVMRAFQERKEFAEAQVALPQLSPSGAKSRNHEAVFHKPPQKQEAYKWE